MKYEDRIDIFYLHKQRQCLEERDKVGILEMFTVKKQLCVFAQTVLKLPSLGIFKYAIQKHRNTRLSWILLECLHHEIWGLAAFPHQTETTSYLSLGYETFKTDSVHCQPIEPCYYCNNFSRSLTSFLIVCQETWEIDQGEFMLLPQILYKKCDFSFADACLFFF